MIRTLTCVYNLVCIKTVMRNFHVLRYFNADIFINLILHFEVYKFVILSLIVIYIIMIIDVNKGN